ncbi:MULTISPECIES: enoyl-CoA hydratase/isomerase family protein [Duganella]|uniref:Enoyl-CoA hydratase/isomerase family protein n=2 Tax=Duganella TaxID=75654 RepID=A0A845GUB1_9BURK|nr:MULTISPECIES: enoyl-CoA hydratase/isomerase family protein [Duganella]MYM80767.1 enoyl-CoA hydratase/isomerase family protein [Duganella lactea]MYM96129.1 enoyl-CoA hydratase/isomerase family protein [Duganella vulcania]
MNQIKLIVAAIFSGVLSFNVAYAQDTNAATSAASPQAKSTIRVERLSASVAKVHFYNAPINFIVPETIAAVNDAVKALSKDDQIKVVIFVSDMKGYFFNHFDTTQFPAFLGQRGTDNRPLWVELITNLSNAPFVTIASIRGRTQGGGNELTLAFDLRYASKEKAIFDQPEVGIGLFPGGGGTDMLTRLAGRDRALEAFLSGDDYSAELAEKYGWVTRAIPDAQLDGFVERMAYRLASFDKTALVATKQRINETVFPNETERMTSYTTFTKSLAWPGLQQRLPVFGKMYQEVGLEKVEGNMGYYVGEGNKQLQANGKAKK